MEADLREERLSLALADCLDALNGAPDDVDAALGRYPDLEDELRRLLKVAAILRDNRPRMDPPPDSLQRIRERLKPYL
ncbi:MAG: hypothetical protein HYS09_04185 [Chloroflexi bacterium]|nr:hypothetical protein [Chloroflexota bacterium]